MAEDLFAARPPKAVDGIRAGIGGWTFVPWRNNFYPAGLVQRRELEYASRHVSAIEINGTYYGTQQPATYARWRDETPDGWWVTGYPWSEINTPEHRRFREAYEKRWKDYPRAGSVVGYTSVYAIAAAVKKANSADTEKLVASLKGLEMQSPFGPIVWRPIDHQSTMGAYVGQLAKRGGKGVMVNWRYADGGKYQPSDQEIRALRKE